jgi:hypothetical protein
MRLIMLCCIALLAGSSRLPAQSLDIGGIELTIGQPIETALAKLSGVYAVRFDDTDSGDWKTWNVETKEGDKSLGAVSSVGGKVALIQKDYHFPSTGDVPPMYTTAMTETQRRGGKVCTTKTPRTGSDSMIRMITTDCGKYTLTLHLPKIIGSRLFQAYAILGVAK